MNSTSSEAAAPSVLRCPRCTGGALELVTTILRCTGCSRTYPFIAGIPCLVDDPSLWRAQMARRLDDFMLVTETRLRNLRREAQYADLLPATRERIARVAGAIEEQRASLRALLEPLREGAPVPPASPVANQEDDKLALLECYENIFRDWAWGEREGEHARRLVESAAAQPFGRLAVYGAGAARLAFDIHRTLGPSDTLALDINPLPMLVAAKLLRGETVDLVEFPVAPVTADQVVVSHHLHCPLPVRPGFTLVFADALHPPFAACSLDSVLTPWFIDAARADFREIAAAINRVLRQGGLWINVGPLRFNNALSRCYSIEEILEIVTRSGFQVLSQKSEAIPYFESPLGGAHRIDSVVCFAARKTAAAPRFQAPSLAPRWITDPALPIPVTPAMTALRRSSVFAVGVIALVDGTRSIADLSRTLAGSWKVDPAVVQDQLRAFFSKLPPT